MTRRSSGGLALAFGMLLAACGSSPTQILVVVDSDLSVPMELDQITFTVTDPDGSAVPAEADLSISALPAVLALQHTDGPLGPFEVVASGRAGGADIVSRRARFSFVPGRVLVLRLDLLAGCRGVMCSGAETCAASGCRSVDVPETELAEWTGTPPTLDDGGPDPVDSGGVDAGPLDSGPLDAGGFDPTLISGLVLWLDPSLVSSVTAARRDEVSQIDDLSGNANHFEQTRGMERPEHVTGINGQMVLAFDGNNDDMAAATAGGILQNVGGATAFLVAESQAGGGNQRMFFVSNDTAPSTRFGLVVNEGLGTTLDGMGDWSVGGRRLDADDLQVVVGGDASAGTAALVTGVIDYAGGTITLYVDGVMQSTSTMFQTPGSTSDTASNSVSLGANGDGDDHASFEMGELLLYSRALADLDRSNVETYLLAKWGL